MFRYLIPSLIIVIGTLVACSEDDYPVQLEQAQIERLLTGDTSKTWIPTAPLIEECELVKRKIFSISGASTARVRAYQTDYYSPNCPEEIPPGDSGSETGTWVVTNLGNIFNLSIYHDDTTHFEIKQITAQKLDLVQKDSNLVLNLKVLIVN